VLIGLFLLAVVFFISIKYELSTIYYAAYFLTLSALLYCLAFSLKKPISKVLEHQREVRYEYEHSGGRGVFNSSLETDAAVAIVNQDTITLTRCIKKGLNVNAVGYEGTFLIFAVRNNAAFPIFRILLNHGANPNVTDNSGNSLAVVLNSATLNRKNDLFRLLLNRGMKVPEYWFFFEDSVLDIFFEKGISINQKFKVNYYQSMYKGKRVSWSPDYTVNKGAFRNPRLHTAEWTPIMILAADFHVNKAKRFHELGADISFKDENGVDLLEILETKKIIISNDLTRIIDNVGTMDSFIQEIQKSASSSVGESQKK
jgi:hypothetical protein